MPLGEDYCGQNHWNGGIHPHPTSCDKYIQCLGFVTTITSCPPGQRYHPIYQACAVNAPPCNDATTTTPSITAGPVCVNTSRGDILFIFDSSSSIGYPDYLKQLSFAANITTDFPVGENNVLFSVLVFSVVAESIFNFSSYLTHDELRKAIMATNYVGSTTNTFLALDFARETSFSPAQGSRSGVPHIAVILTDGLSSNFAETKNAAQRLKDSGVIVLPIGIGQFNRTELDAMATNVNDVKQVGSYDSLRDVLRQDVSKLICSNAVNTNCSSMKMADIIFLLDSSSGILFNDYQKLLRFAANLTQHFKIGPNDVRFAALTFGTVVRKLFDLNTYNNQAQIIQAITSAQYLSSSTNTAGALQYILDNNMFGTVNGGRDGVTKLIITITDGGSDKPELTRTQAALLKNKGYKMMAIGIGHSLNTAELVTLSTDMRNIFIVDTFDGLGRLQDEVYNQTCEIPSQTNAGELWNICREQNWENGIHAHPFDCTKFIECTFLHTSVMFCPPSLVFDPLKKTCMHRNDAISCNDYNDYNPFPSLVTVRPSINVQADVSTVCRENHWPNGPHPHPYDCSFYLLCTNGVTSLQPCPSQLVYDPSTSSCRDAAVALPCNDAHHSYQPPSNGVTPASGIDMRSVCYDFRLPDGIYPDPGSCVHYVECSNGNTYHMQCPDGLEFNTKISVCDDVHKINCADNYGFSFTVHIG
ncbi:collagen alpha-1(XIV) chain [Biomphalaria glabrata]|nr:collagen alpha-1(XIV) chain [Biomphalaria glabrata]